MACSAVKIPSPVAVRSATLSESIEALTASRSVDGAINIVAFPANSTRPRLIPGVSSSANCLPASLAAANRFGSTSGAAIDSETSMTSITTARLRGTCTS